ncbi:MAG: TonB-dependent receptor, partial [Methylocella sp.]
PDAANIFAAACVIAAGSVTTAEAQQAPVPLSPVTVNPPKVRQRPVVSKPTKAQLKVRTALRHKIHQTQRAQAAPTRAPASAPTAAPGAVGLPTFAQITAYEDPYANPAAPYMAERLSSNKFTQPIVNTPRSVTVLTREVLDDENATSLRDIGRSTAGVTLGSGEGGNAFGDRFFIRGFDARNDIFVDGIRDPGVSIRENFFTEQVEILRGPASSFAGRGTTGGAINIVTKKATDQDFNIIETTLGSDQTKRVTVDVNKAINPVLDVRVNGMFQNADVAGRDFTTDDRNGIAGALTFKPIPSFTLMADYSHTYLDGLPDFGVPYNLTAERPVTEGVVPRNTYYGIVNRDFTKTTQNLGTLDGEYKVNDWLTLTNKLRQGYSILNYIGTIPENPSGTGINPIYVSTPTYFSGYIQLNPQSRFETAAVLVDQPELTAKFDTGPFNHAAVFGSEFSHERISINSYTGLTSEGNAAEGLFSPSGAPIVSIYDPTNFLTSVGLPTLGNNPQIYNVNTKAVYLLDTANYDDRLLLNAGVRFDDYGITSSNNTSSAAANDGIVNYNVGIVYKPIPIGSLYAAYATSADPVGDELDATASSYGGLSPSQPVSQVFGPQRSQAVELGTKWELFDRRLLATAAAFQTNVENARESTPAGLPGYPITNTIVAGAAYRVQGLDFEVAGKITDRWSVFGGLVLMKSDVTKSIVPHNIGLELANIAHQSFNLLSKYEVTDWLEFGGQAIYASQIYGGSLLAANGGVAYNQAPDPTVLPSHWRFDTFVEAKIGPYTSLKLYVQNIFNRTYYDSIYQSGVPFIRVAPGRSVSLIATAKF